MTQSPLQEYPLVPCRLCGAALESNSWHCLKCGNHNGLMRNGCSTCHASMRHSCGIFEPMCELPTVEFLLEYHALPFSVTIVATIEDFALAVEERDRQRAEEGQTT
jgi:hypothetical protein